MSFPDQQQRESAKRMIADHDSRNFYTFDQRIELLSLNGNYMAALVNRSDPMQVGDLLCELDNARIPFEFRPEVSAKLIRNDLAMADFNPSSIHKAIVGLGKEPTVDDNVRDLVLRIMEHGVDDTTRTGVKSRAVDSAMYTYDISLGQVPAVSQKYTWNYGVIVELIWMLSGSTSIAFLKEHDVDIWDSWVTPGTEVYRDYTLEERIKWAKKAGLQPSFDWNGEPNRHTVDVLDQNNVPTQKLIDGQLPKIYQHQWRGWGDTRIVCRDEADKLEQEGYEFRGMLLTPDDLSSGACNGSVAVVSRRIDQLAKIIDQLKNKPDDRGIILSAWNVAELEEMALRPCHTLCQFFSKPMSVRERLEWMAVYKPAGFEHLSDDVLAMANAHDDRRHETQMKFHPETFQFLEDAKVPTRKLSSTLYMRSNDIPLGHPFNIVQYALLTHMVAQVVGMAADTFTWMGGDCHIYENQWPGVLEWMAQKPQADSTPTVNLNPHITNLTDFGVDDVNIVGYKHGGKVKFPKAAV